MRALLAAVLLAAATPALADSTSGTVAGFNPATHTLTLGDRTVWMLPADTAVPDGLAAGNRVVITYVTQSDNGWVKIVSIAKVD